VSNTVLFAHAALQKAIAYDDLGKMYLRVNRHDNAGSKWNFN